MRTSRRRGAALVVALFLISVLLLSGLGFLMQKRSEYAAARDIGLGSQAFALAQAGLADVKAKLLVDWDFPRVAGADQPALSYSEPVLDRNDQIVGFYQVDIDLRSLRSPFYILKVRSTGRVPPLSNPAATRSLEMEIDMDPNRSTYFRVVNWRDLGAL